MIEEEESCDIEIKGNMRELTKGKRRRIRGQDIPFILRYPF